MDDEDVETEKVFDGYRWQVTEKAKPVPSESKAEGEDRDRDTERRDSWDRRRSRDRDSRRDERRRDDRRRRSRSRSRGRDDRRRRSRSSDKRRRDRSRSNDRAKYDGEGGEKLTATQKMALLLAKAKESAPVGMSDQGTRKARRLYVGNIVPGTTEQMLVDFFEAAVQQAGMVIPDVKGRAVVSAWVSTDEERRFAFVEFRSMEECASALALNGIVFQGESLRVSRPSDYEDAVRTMSMQGLAMPAPNMAVIPANNLMAGAPLEMAPTETPSSALRLLNMVGADDLNDPDDIADISADVSEECGKYGAVKEVQIPGAGQPGAGSVFVLFGDVAAATNAKGVLHGRLFDGKAIQATFFEDAKMAAKDFA
jgi:splicing factor U2AF subunit